MLPEIAAVFFMSYTSRIHAALICIAIMNMYRDDAFYANKDFSGYSLSGPDGSDARMTLEKFSERFVRLYPGYVLDRKQRIRALPATPAINLKQLVALLKSKDEALWERSKWIYDVEGGLFLDGEANPCNKVAFASFPRSGNTFLRKYLQLLTGVTTGSDNPISTDPIQL